MQKIASGIFKLTFGTPEEFTPVSVLKPVTCLEALNAHEDHPLPFLRRTFNFNRAKAPYCWRFPWSRKRKYTVWAYSFNRSDRAAARRSCARIPTRPRIWETPMRRFPFM